MKTVTVYGGNDDCIEFSGIPGCDEFYSKAAHGSNYAGQFHITSESEEATMVVHAIYAGSWCFAVSAIDGDDSELLPKWMISRTWGQDVEYSETLNIIVPDDAKLHRLR